MSRRLAGLRRSGGRPGPGWSAPAGARRSRRSRAASDPRVRRSTIMQECIVDGEDQDRAAVMRLGTLVDSRRPWDRRRRSCATARVGRWPRRTAWRGRPAARRLFRSPRARAISKRTSSGMVKCWNSATISAKPSWKAGTSGFEASWKRRCRPSSSACVISCATMSLDRQEKTIDPAVVASPRRNWLESSRTATPSCRGCSRRCRSRSACG